jgi:FlaG/FlaF family flagellin (archaellin)
MEDEGAGHGNGMARSRKHMARSRSGVSDIIGTILILAITVILFSSIFFFVSSLPGPTAQSTSQFTASLGVSSGKTEAFVNISYTTGPLLPTASTQIYLISSLHQSNFVCTPTATAGDPYTIGDGLGGSTTWSAGQTWTLHLAPPGSPTTVTTCPGSSVASLLSTGDQVTIKIVNTAQNNLLLFQVTLPGTVASTPPVFIAEGISPSPMQGTGPFYVWAQIKSNVGINTSNAVFADLTNVNVAGGPLIGPPSLPASCNPGHSAANRCLVGMILNTTNGWYCTPLLNLTTSLTSTYAITISATDKIGQKNSAVINAQFTTTTGVQMTGTDYASPGSPYVGENTTIVLTITNTAPVSALISVEFMANHGNFCPSQKTCTQVHDFNLTSVNVPINYYSTVYAYWTAGAVNGGTGQAQIQFFTSPISPTRAIPVLNITVLPRTLLVDGTGIPSGSLNPLDTFTYVSNDFLSAGLADPPDVVDASDAPGTTAASWTTTGAAKTCSAAMDQSNASSNLACYDVIVWDAGNYTSGTSTCISYTDALAIYDAISIGHRSVWLMGGDALSAGCFSDEGYPASLENGLETVFGLSGPGAVTNSASSTSLSLTGITLPTTGIVGSNLYLGAAAYYTPLVTTTSQPYMRIGSAGPTVASFYTSAIQGNAFASSFDIATLSAEVPLGGAMTASTGQQASVVYDVFDWLANLTSGGSNVRMSPDWAVSQVVVTPSPTSFQTPTFVNVTVRNNGPSVPTGGITVSLTVNGGVYTGAAPITLNPSASGGSLSGTIIWYPAVIGYVTVGAMISPPTSDSVPANNLMSNSLFNVQLYIHYSVLIVDDTLSTLLHKPDTTPIVVAALEAAQYPISTITVVSISTACGPAVLPPGMMWASFNVVVWNDGSNTNNSGGSGSCPLSDANANALASFLGNGGLRSSLLFVGAGLLTDVNDANVRNFAANYLGVVIPGALVTATTTSTLYGNSADVVGDGMAITPYLAGQGNYTYCTTTPGLLTATVSPSLFYDALDYWTPWNAAVGGDPCGGSAPPIAASDAFGALTGGWHTAYWSFSLSATGDSSQVSLLMLRTSTFFGRLLPSSDTVVTPPDITFATVTAPWTNFDGMHPQLEQQYLIQANITNLGSSLASNIGISVYDGSHILGSQTLTIGGSATNATGLTTLGTGQLSVSWTPLYGGSNPISVKITTSTVGQILPGVDNAATWPVTVYFFYDSTTSNVNSWSHSQESLVQTNVNPQTCYVPPGGDAFLWEYINNPVEWPGFSTTSCAPPQSDSAFNWGEDHTYCFITTPYCASLAIRDGGSNENSVTWAYSSPITVPASASSVTASWWQSYNLAPSANGGIVCIDPPGVTLTAGVATSNAVLNSINYCVSETPPSPTYSSPAAPAVENGGICYFNPSFSGSSLGGTGGWQNEKMNLSAYAGQTVRIAFGYIEGDTAACLGTTNPELGWFIDDFTVSASGGPANPATLSQAYSACASQGANIPTDLWEIESQSALGGTLAGMGLPANSVPTGSAWVAGAWKNGVLTLDPNMWDSLYSRPIDLSSALTATLNFNYAWGGVFWSDTGGYGPPYFYPMSPQQDFVIEIAPAGVATTVTPWVQVWSADSWTASQYNGADTRFEGVIAGSASWTGAGVAVGAQGWHSVSISLAAYVGQVIQLRLLVGTNCGNAPGDAQFNYPMTESNGNTMATGAMLSGMTITGTTTISASIGAPSTSFVAPPSMVNPAVSTSRGNLPDQTYVYHGASGTTQEVGPGPDAGALLNVLSSPTSTSSSSGNTWVAAAWIPTKEKETL